MLAKFINFITICIFLVILCSSILSEEFLYPYQDAQFIKIKWTTEEGLPQNSVPAIIQTQDGYIWMATFGGLVRFDGIKFTVFNPANTPQMQTGRITALFEDEQETLWIGSEFGDVLKYKDGKFENFLKNKEPDADVIWNFLVEEDQIWIVGKGVLSRYDLEGNLIKNYARTFPVGDNFAARCIIQDKTGKMWFGTTLGLMEFDEGKLQLVEIRSQTIENYIVSVKENSKGEIFVATGDTIFKISEQEIETIFKVERNEPIFYPIIGNFYISSKDEIWFESQLFLYKYSENKFQKYDLRDVLSDNTRSIFVDRENNIWIGSNSDGLIKIKELRVKAFGMFKQNNKNLFPTQSIVEDKNGMMWIGSSYLLSYKNGKFDSYLLRQDDYNPPVRSLAVDDENTLWIGTGRGLMSMKDGFPTNHTPNENETVRCLFFDSKKTLWVGRAKSGLQKFENGTFITYNKEKDGLVSNTINFIKETKNGDLWIGTNNGLSILKDGKFTNYAEKDKPYFKMFRDMYEDTDGKIWLATYGGGILRYADGQFTTITEDQGLAENIASRILTDDEENFWILGNKGIYTVSKKSLNEVADGLIDKVVCRIFGVQDGMIVSEGNGGNHHSGWKASDGKLWFPTLRGGVIIDPKLKSDIPPNVLVEEVLLENEKLDKRKQIEIPYDTGNLEIQYTALSFNKPEQTQFYYKMEGLDKHWIDAGTRRKAFYPYLPPGNYKFSVKAINADGVWSNESSLIEIKVAKPFWQKWWFIVFCVLALASLLYFIYRLRLRQLKQQQLKQKEFSKRLINAHESERQRIAKELHDGLGQNLLIIKNWALLGINNSSENKANIEQLEEISETATNALEEARTIVGNLRPQNIARFGLTETLNNMIEQVESSTGVLLEKDIGNIDKLFSDEAEISIYRIVQECLNNIIKHSESPRAKVRIKKSDNQVKILISDYGKGFSIDEYFDKNYDSSGFGLQSISQRVNLLGGNLAIDSNIGEGTKISIILKV